MFYPERNHTFVEFCCWSRVIEMRKCLVRGESELEAQQTLIAGQDGVDYLIQRLEQMHIRPGVNIKNGNALPAEKQCRNQTIRSGGSVILVCRDP